MNSSIGQNCPYCMQPIKEQSDAKICPQCSMPHHSDCWNENQGCAVYGCSGLEDQAPTVEVTNDENTKTCPYCSETIVLRAIYCPHCHSSLGEDGSGNRMQGTFSIGDALRIGLNLTMQNIGLFIGATIVMIIVEMVSDAIVGSLLSSVPIVGLVFLFGSIILTALMSAGIIKIAFNIYDNKPRSVNDLFSTTDVVFNFLGATILVSILTTVGALFFVVPGIIIGFLLMFVPQIVVDQRAGVLDSLQQSFTLVKNNVASLIGLVLIIAVINFVGALLIGLGLIITVPMTMLVFIHVYRSLQAQ